VSRPVLCAGNDVSQLMTESRFSDDAAKCLVHAAVTANVSATYTPPCDGTLAVILIPCNGSETTEQISITQVPLPIDCKCEVSQLFLGVNVLGLPASSELLSGGALPAIPAVWRTEFNCQLALSRLLKHLLCAIQWPTECPVQAALYH
jgi:hypothetical protein